VRPPPEAAKLADRPGLGAQRLPRSLLPPPSTIQDHLHQVVVTAVSPRLTVLGVVVPSLPKAAENEARTVGRPTTLLRARISTEDPEGIIEATTARPEALPQTWGETYQANLAI